MFDDESKRLLEQYIASGNRQPEMRSYTPPWYDRLAGAVSDWWDGGSRNSYQAARKFTGPENPFNVPAQITEGAGNAVEGYRRGDIGQTSSGVIEALLAAAPLAGRPVGAGIRKPMLYHGRSEFDIPFPLKDGETARIYGSVDGTNAVVDGAFGPASMSGAPWSAGHSSVAKAARELKNQFPYVTDVYAQRVSGARDAAGKSYDNGLSMSPKADAVRDFLENTEMGYRIGSAVDAMPRSAQNAIDLALMKAVGAPPDAGYNMHLKVKPGWQK